MIYWSIGEMEEKMLVFFSLEYFKRINISFIRNMHFDLSSSPNEYSFDSSQFVCYQFKLHFIFLI